MEDVSIPYLDPNYPFNDTDISVNYYSNGESRLAPDYEWNGWKKYRGQKSRIDATIGGKAFKTRAIPCREWR